MASPPPNEANAAAKSRVLLQEFAIALLGTAQAALDAFELWTQGALGLQIIDDSGTGTLDSTDLGALWDRLRATDSGLTPEEFKELVETQGIDAFRSTEVCIADWFSDVATCREQLRALAESGIAGLIISEPEKKPARWILGLLTLADEIVDAVKLAGLVPATIDVKEAEIPGPSGALLKSDWERVQRIPTLARQLLEARERIQNQLRVQADAIEGNAPLAGQAVGRSDHSYLLADLLKDLRDRDYYGKIVTAYCDPEASKRREANLATPSVEHLQTICKAREGKFSADALEKLCAAAALARGKTLSDLITWDLTCILDALLTFTGEDVITYNQGFPSLVPDCYQLLETVGNSREPLPIRELPQSLAGDPLTLCAHHRYVETFNPILEDAERRARERKPGFVVTPLAGPAISAKPTHVRISTLGRACLASHRLGASASPARTEFHYHNHSVNIQGAIQGSNVALGGSPIDGSTASYSSTDELVEAIEALMPLIPTEAGCQQEAVAQAVTTLIRAAGDSSIAAPAVGRAAEVIASSSPTLRQRLGDIAGRIGVSLTGSAVFQAIKAAIGIP